MIIVLALWRRTTFVETTWLTQERIVTVVGQRINLLMVPVCKTGAAMGQHVVFALMWSAGESICTVFSLKYQNGSVQKILESHYY